jgi:hypothetical protein
MKIHSVSLEVQAFHIQPWGLTPAQDFRFVIEQMVPVEPCHERWELIDLIYEAVLDNDLWPSVLIKLAEADIFRS